jgi:hypothetical protein
MPKGVRIMAPYIGVRCMLIVSLGLLDSILRKEQRPTYVSICEDQRKVSNLLFWLVFLDPIDQIILGGQVDVGLD